MTHRTLHPLLLAAVALAVLTSAESARASMTYPPIVAKVAGLPADPPCMLCHADDQGGVDTVVTPFGVTMLRFDVQPAQPDSLRAALEQAARERPDSDFDGVDDLAELRAGTDPNDGIQLPTPRTGCSIANSASHGDHAAVGLGALAVALFFGERCAKRRSKSARRA